MSNKLIYISATWCGPCKLFAPVMNRVGTQVTVEKLDAEIYQGRLKAGTIQDYGIKSIPTTVKVDASGKMLDKFVGVKKEAEVLDFYNQQQLFPY
jgi:thioredoxin-like negative regulator of GroEL